MTEFWLVRHGQTDWNAEQRLQGHTDIPLNAAGLAQARELAAHLAGLGQPGDLPYFSAIYSSDLSRAFQTAQCLAETLALAVQPHPGLREIHLGDWEGQVRTDIQARFPELVAQRRTNPLEMRSPGGESARELLQRTARAADEIARAYPSGRVLVVSHGITLSALICLAKGYSLDEVYRHGPENAQPVVVHWPPTAL